MSEQEALANFRLAPLGTRRNIAMLGVVLRAVLKKRPPQSHGFIVRAEQQRTTRSSDWHSLQLKTYRDGEHLEVLKRSVLGLVEVFNVLPTAVVEGSQKVRSFQAQLQELTLTASRDGVEDWKILLNADKSDSERRTLKQFKG